MAAAHWFDRPWFLQEADRLLKPRGCLALISYTLDMDLEYGQHSHTLTDICHQVRQQTTEELIDLIYKIIKNSRLRQMETTLHTIN